MMPQKAILATVTLQNVVAYTDGACSGNPGPGGWGAVLSMMRDGALHEKEIFGGEPATTNNRMELRGVIAALNALKNPVHITIHTDSQYVLKGMTEWITGWKARGWRTADKKPVKNEDLWRELDAACAAHQVSWVWVKGHAGNVGNERADALARRGILSI